MRRLLLGLAAGVLLAAPAIADGPARRAPAYAAPVFSWAGYYVGVQGGYAWEETEHSIANVATGAWDVNGGFGGVSWGSNWQSGSLVYGFSSDFSLASLKEDFAGVGCAGGSCFTNVKYFGTSSVRVGYAMDRTLIYVTGGYTYARVEAGIANTINQDTKTRYGWTVGAGVEWAIAPKWSAKLEYQHLDYGDRRNYYVGANSGEVDLSADIVRVGLNYKVDLSFLPRF